MQLVVNELLQHQQEPDKVERIVWVDHENHWCFLVNINAPSFPYREEINDIEQRLKAGDVKKLDDDPMKVLINEEQLSDAELRKRDLAWEIIDWVYQIPDIFIPKIRSKQIKSASIKFGVSEKTIRRQLKRFWMRGMVKNSLLPDYFRCGQKEEGERIYTKKAGRAFEHSSSIKRGPVNDEWKKIFRVSLEKYYFVRSKPSLKHAYQQMLKGYFSAEDGVSGYKVVDLENPIPSFQQFYYWFRKWYKSDYSTLKREGSRVFLQNHRSITGSAMEDAMGVGVYAVDGTVGDIYLVSSLNRNNVIGRPLIYLILDIYSHCIVGLHVSIQNMSGSSLNIALANAFENKQEFCQKTLGIEIDEDEWPIHYLPHTLLADRGGELISDELTRIVENLNIRIQNSAPYRPDMKGTCEQFFNILQQHIKPFLPGAVDKDFGVRGSLDYRKKSVLTLNEYARIFVRCAIYFNNHHYLKGYQRTQAMIEENIPAIPIRIFQWGQKRQAGLRTLSSDLIRVNLMPTATASVRAKGISFKGLYYTSTTALKERWFTHARTKGSWKISVQYDPRDLSSIFIRKSRTEYEACTLLEQYDMYRSAKIEEVMDLKTFEKEQQVNAEQGDLNGQIKLAQEIEKIVGQAKKEAKMATTDEKMKKNIKDMRQNRKKEQQFLHDLAGQKKKNLMKETTSHSGDAKRAFIRNIDLFRQKQKEGLSHEDD